MRKNYINRVKEFSICEQIAQRSDYLRGLVVDRRLFFHSMVGGVATAAAVRTWPFRVYSFPTELRLLSIEVFNRGVEGQSVKWLILPHARGFGF
jgi:hypothetical protein